MAVDGLPVRAELIARRDLGAPMRDAMRVLMDRHFLGVTREVFERDLAEKNHAIVLRDASGALRGFTTLAIERTEHAGEALRVVYSGDTIVDVGARNGFALASAWITAVRVLCPPSDGTRVLWLLICSSIRTYRFLPVFFREFVPQAGSDAPARALATMHALAARRYGAAFDPAAGIVRLSDPQPVRPGRQACDEGPDVEWFATRNPGHLHGDELVCLCDLGDDNLTAAGRRMVRSGERARALHADGTAA